MHALETSNPAIEPTGCDQPRVVQTMRNDAEKNFVFRSENTLFAVPAVNVREIMISPPWVAVPHSHPSLIGICHLRSQFVPVLSLNSLIHAATHHDNRTTGKLLLLESVSVWAVQIEGETALQSLETLVTPESKQGDFQQPFVRGTATFRNQIIHVLDPNQIVLTIQEAQQSYWAQSSAMVANTQNGSLR